MRKRVEEVGETDTHDFQLGVLFEVGTFFPTLFALSPPLSPTHLLRTGDGKMLALHGNDDFPRLCLHFETRIEGA